MTDPLHVCLGRHGDIMLALPSLKKWADANGRPAAALTSREFMPMLEGCSYVKATEWEGDFSQLPACLDFLKTDLPQVDVKCLQFYQSGQSKALPSFWHEQMYLAGLLGGGEDLPLVFDRRDRKEDGREFNLIYDHIDFKRPEVIHTILFCGKGHSSPFKDADALLTLIREAFPDCNVVDLSKVKAERIYDLIGLYDHAAALITIDTAHLHLSKASRVPVFALARDYPDRWHGTPQLDRFAWYCRYGQVMERADELIGALRDTIDGVQRVKPELLPLPRGAYNPSIILHEGRELISYRHHPNRDWRTEIMLDGLPVRFPYPVSTCAHEDMRLFTFRGELWASYVCSRGFRDDPRCVVGYGKLIRMPEFWAIEGHFQPDMPGNDWSGMQKNMVCWEWPQENELYAQWNDQIIMRLDGNHCWQINLDTDPLLIWPYGEIRGGTSPLPFKGKWLRFFHSRIWPERKEKNWRYHIGALVMEPHPPFNTIAISKKPILSGDESGDPMIWHFKHSVVFPLGCVEDGAGWKVSLGINDAHCAILRVKEGDLNL